VIGAFAYLIVNSSRNLLLSKVRRLRSPRYAIALLLSGAYFYFFFFRRFAHNSADAPAVMGTTIENILPVGLLLMAAYAWIFGADRAALAFSEAEVAMLFTAPVSRRGLVVYKLVRAQAAVLTTSIIWSVVFGRGGRTFEGFASYWIFLSVISLHRLGVALVRAATSEHGFRGFRRSWLPIVVFGVAAAMIASTIYSRRGQLMQLSDISDVVPTLVAIMATPPMSWVLYPFRVAVAPIAAAHGWPWLHAIGPALVLVALHVWWVLRTESAFEEAAAEASVAHAKRIAAVRSRGTTAMTIKSKSARRGIGLRSTGNPSVALIWKNYLWLQRTGQLRTLIGFPLLLGVVAIACRGRGESPLIVVTVLCAVFSIMVLVFGPMVMRNDLRGELRRLPMLKTMPLTGRQIMLAEVASSALPTTLMQFLLVAAGLLAVSFLKKAPIPMEMRIGAQIGAPFLLLGINLANFTIHNGLALLFPAWVRLGETGAAGIEMMGQTMLTMIVTLVMLAVVLLTPALLGGGTYFAMRSSAAEAIASGCIVAGIVLVGEAYLLIGVLGSSLQRLEPMQVG
jgi:ABC-2 type transport system permease protein